MGSLPPWSFLPMGIGEQPCRWLAWLLAISSPSTVFPNYGYRGGDAVTSGDLVSLHSLSFLWVSGSNPADGSLGFWRSRLPPQSFLTVGIGKATPLLLAISSPSTVFPSCGYRGGDAVDASHWRRLQRLILATPSASYSSDAFSVLMMPGAINLLTLTLALTLTSTLVDAWGAVAESLMSRPHHPRGISHMADGMFPHLT